MYRNYIKRWMDIFFSASAIIILLPVFLILAFLIGMDMGFPIIYKQERVGKDEKIFVLYKFRTMNNKRDRKGHLLPDRFRITKLGKFLRGTSLDELPELVNILKGDISIVGPRPLLVAYLPYYTDYERQRHNVRGGLTVPEVLYNNIMPTWEEQFAYEVDYANNYSFFMDLRIIFKTVTGLIIRNQKNYGLYIRQPLTEERKTQNEKSNCHTSA